MPILRERIIRRNHKQYEAYRISSANRVKIENPKLYNEFLSREQELTDLLGDAKYWHGTGRYQYEHKGESKYDGVIHSKIKDVLNDLITVGGLQPRYDPWFKKYVHSAYSLSVANQWFYGKMYAHYHLDEKKALAFEIAPISFWYRMMIRIQMTENYCKFSLGFLLVYTFSNALQKQGKLWMSTFRSDTNKKWPPWKILTAQSDIDGNYGLLFALESEIATMQIMKTGRFFETRTIEPVPFSKMKFISVPQANVIETKSLLADKHIDLPVIPLELIEIYMLRFTLREILYSAHMYKSQD